MRGAGAGTRHPRAAPCEVDGCHHPKAAQSNWCSEHTCTVAGCHSETFDDDEHKCMEHMGCQENGCHRYCEITGHGRDAKVEMFCATRKPALSQLLKTESAN